MDEKKITDNADLKVNDTELEQLDSALDKFQTYLQGDGSTTPTLRANWVYLQIFATYGLRLPSTDAALQNTLSLSEEDTSDYTWFDAMREAYTNLDTASQYFFNEVFNTVTDLGNGLQDYTTDVIGEDSTFTFISSLVEPGKDQDLEAALDELSDLKKTASENADLAQEIKENLTKYKIMLVESQAETKTVKEQVDEDDRTSQATIDALNADEDEPDSLAHIRKLLAVDKADYKHDVIVASTTATYAWVMVGPVPVGLITAAFVAGFYSHYAVEELKEIHRLKDQIEAAEAELRFALATQGTVTLAQNSIDNVLKHVGHAIEKTTVIQNAWNGIERGLAYISTKVEGTLKADSEDNERLSSIKIIQHYLRKAQTRWTEIQPTVNEMVADPFITVNPEEVSISDFLGQVEEEMKRTPES